MFNKIILTTMLLITSVFAQNGMDILIKGEKIFMDKCAVCHVNSPPVGRIAPPIQNVLMHLDMEFKKEEDISRHIYEYTLNPTKEKAICPSARKFGLMPSQKGNITEEEMKIVSDYLANIVVTQKNSGQHKGGTCGGHGKKGSCGGSCGGHGKKHSCGGGCGQH